MRGAFKILILCVGIVFAVPAHAVLEYSVLAAKAQRFVNFQEWGSALAMYDLMIDQRPAEIVPYAHAIVVSGIMNDRKSQIQMLEGTQKHGIPLDSIFSQVRAFSFSISHSQVYQQFLELVKERQPWIARNIDIQLLNYFIFRCDGANMVIEGERLLAGTPDNIQYLAAVARGYALQGSYEQAMKRYKQILAFDASNYDALLSLGNYYYILAQSPSHGSASAWAIQYLSQAYKIFPTPFVANALKELQSHP